MKAKNLSELFPTKEARTKYFASGRVSVKKIGQYCEVTRNFYDSYIGMVRGCIIPREGKPDSYKFATKEEAAQNARRFRNQCKLEVELLG